MYKFIFIIVIIIIIFSLFTNIQLSSPSISFKIKDDLVFANLPPGGRNTPGGRITPGSTPSSTPPLSSDCLTKINSFRQSKGLAPLSAAPAEKQACTNTSAQSDGAAQTFHGSFGKCGEKAQCECNGQSTVEQCIQAYINEGPGGGHYEILKGNYSSVACGIANINGRNFYTHNFY